MLVKLEDFMAEFTTPSWRIYNLWNDTTIELEISNPELFQKLNILQLLPLKSKI